jgi:radical SAM-linked protein
MTRVRIRFAKLGKIRWTSHRDVARMWERAFRRVQLPVAYSTGYSPRPRVSFGLALPTGHESVAEYLDVELADSGARPALDVRTLPGRLSAALPSGVDATAAEVIPPGTPSLQEDVTSCTWRWAAAPVEGTDPLGLEELARRVQAVLASSSVVVTRTRKGEEHTDDIRAGIFTLELLGPVGSDPSHGAWLEADLTSRPRGLRPAEVLAALDPGLEERHVRRMHQWILRDGARREPLEAVSPGATDAPHAWERAS